MNEERFKKIVAVLIALVTVAATGIAYLQSDAGARDDAANRDTKRYAMEAFGRKVNGDSRVNFDYNSAYQAWSELDLLATSATNRGDDAAAKRYLQLRDEVAKLSPLLTPPYFNAETGEVDTAPYEVKEYLEEIAVLNEKFAAASVVKNAWDYKSNIYIVHLTLLAVSLFLYGLSVTISGPVTRWIFSGVGTVVGVWGIVWALMIFLQPVPDLRDRTGAIEAYARGTGLAYQNKFTEAIAAYDEALRAAPDYANAFAQRAEAQAALNNYPAAISDYEQARANGNESASLAGDLAWTYYLAGRFDDAASMNRVGLKASPSELWIQFDLALSLLAAGKIDEAKTEYVAGMAMAADQVAKAKAAGEQPPSFLWWGLDDAALSLDGLLNVLDGEATAPPLDKIANAETVRSAAQDLIRQLRSQAVSLEYTGLPPAGQLTAQISPFEFGEPVYNEQGEAIDFVATDAFEFGVKEIGILFDYAEMRDGQTVIFKVYINDEEDPSWRVVDAWNLGASGSAEKPLSLAYSDNFVLAAGEYIIEMYVDGHLAQRGKFVVQE